MYFMLLFCFVLFCFQVMKIIIREKKFKRETQARNASNRDNKYINIDTKRNTDTKKTKKL